MRDLSKYYVAVFFLFSIIPIAFANSTQTSYAINYPTQVNYLLKQISPDFMMRKLQELSDTSIFPDRASNHQSGVKATEWAQKQIKLLAKQYGINDVEIFTVATKGVDPLSTVAFDLPQPSIIVKIGKSNLSGIVIGAHIDTVGCMTEGCELGPYPGANDDGSGSATLFEVARGIMASKMKFAHPIYLIWYAAEENGSWGATAVIDYFEKNNMPVHAILQLDQTGYAYHNELSMYLETGRPVDKTLTLYLQKLIQIYVKRPAIIAGDNCHGDSDEWVWADRHYMTARALETNYCEQSHMYPYPHRNTDTIDKINVQHMTDYLKLALAFAVELAKPIE